MANLYTPQQLGITVPSALSGNGNWIQGRQIWNGQLSDPGVINPLSNQQGAGQAVSPQVNEQSAAAQGKTPQQLESYLQTQRDTQAASGIPSTQLTATPGGDTGSTGGMGPGGGVGITPPAALNLPGLYTSLSASAGITDLEKGIADKTTAFNDAQAKINDNPFLSEGNRVGRVAKLTTDYNNSITNDNNTLAMKKQDVQTQLDLATKQFDINSQSAQQALSQFNTLLSSGALAGASGSDIAAITAATGISSSMVQAAIKSQTIKDTPTSMTTVDDGKNIYAVVLNTQTGAIINKQVIGASKPAATTTTAADKTSYYQSALRSDAAAGVPLSKIFATYSGYLDPNTIYQLYNANSNYGPDKGNIANLAKYGVTQPGQASSTASLLQALTGGQ